MPETGDICRVTFILAVVATMAVSCRPGRGGSGTPSDATSPPSAWLQGSGTRQERFRGSNGALEAILSADEVALDDNGQFVMNRAAIELFANDGRTVQAAAARISTNSSGKGDAILEDGVEIAIDDVRVETRTATWLADSTRLVGSGPVTVTGDRISVEGGRFVVEVAAQDDVGVIVDDVTGSIVLKEDDSQHVRPAG